jgi:virginiamycin B lyase
MKSSGLRSRLTALLTAIVVSVGLLSLSSAPAWATAGTITEFPIPTKSAPIGITAGPDGNVWFTEIMQGVGKIGRITPSGTITEFQTPTANSRLEGITAGPDGNLWFTEGSAGKIGRITTQ